MSKRVEHSSMLLTARDVLVSIMLPWHTCNQHRVLICKIRDEIDTRVEDVTFNSTSTMAYVLDVFERCRDVAMHIAFDSGMIRCHDRMMRAKLIFDALITHVTSDVFDVNKIALK